MYSPERNVAIVAKMLLPNNAPLRPLTKEEGISVATLPKWAAETWATWQFLPDINSGSECWASDEKLAECDLF